ncbi:MAG TPA: DCC1-like thiol-disulfide oxidoreductase family protein [Minicystis sp.]|nr:DCC1-like thiol-disulfide oxidoreductase family protein [Minicystis sp.]
MLTKLRDTFLRIDARSLGLFRIAMGAVLIADWLGRHRWLKEFYSNEGVLPNHNHLFLLHDQVRVWSALHAFSSPGENAFAFYVILVVYAFYLVGYKTRAFQVLALVSLVSLTGRNILLENAGNYVAIGLLAFTMFLPLGSRFSIDALRRSLDDVDEKDAEALNRRAAPSYEELVASRAPGWSPVSMAALGALLQVAVVYAVSAYQRTGSWSDGTALHYAVNAELFVTQIGVHARALPAPLLAGWTRVIRVSEILIPILVFVPALTRATRAVAIGLSFVYALSLGALFDFGLYAWTLLAASALFIPTASWDARLAPKARRAVTVIYDADCGLCLALCRLLARLDLRRHLVFQGNDQLESLVVHGYRERASSDLPKEVTPELVLDTVVVVDAERRVLTRGRAASAVVAALPLGWLLAWPMRLPGVAQLVDLAYDFVAARRLRISVLIGKEACGVPQHRADADADADAVDPLEVPSAKRAVRILSGGFREIAAILVLLAMIAQTGHENPVPKLLPLSQPLAAVAQWPRMIAKWDVLAPEPSRLDASFVVDAQTRGGKSVDTLTGLAPSFDLERVRGLDLGQLWGDYLTRVHEKEWSEFQRAFRDYLGKGGPRWENPLGDNGIAGYDTYWVTEPIPPPGEARDVKRSRREKLFSYSRGGKLGDPRFFPVPPGHGATAPQGSDARPLVPGVRRGKD